MDLRRLAEGGGQGPPASPTGEAGELSSLDDLQQRVEWAQRILDDRTLVPVQHKKVQEKPHSVLHLLWGAALVLLIIFVRRLPRFPGVVVPEKLEEGDPLLYWESKNIIGDNPEEGMQLRLRNNPHVAKGFFGFAQLSKESFDRRDKASQRIHTFQKQMVSVFNPLIAVTDRMSNLVKQLPPLSDTVPSNVGDIRAQLQHLSEAETAASDKKEEFIEEWSAHRMRKELYSDPSVATALRNLIDIDSAYMHKKIALLDFLVSEALKAAEGATMSSIAMKEYQFLESKCKAAAHEAERQAAACMHLLPPQDHWLLLLFVENLPPVPPSSPAPAENQKTD